LPLQLFRMPGAIDRTGVQVCELHATVCLGEEPYLQTEKTPLLHLQAQTEVVDSEFASKVPKHPLLEERQKLHERLLRLQVPAGTSPLDLEIDTTYRHA
jgi:hypothetical protein